MNTNQENGPDRNCLDPEFEDFVFPLELVSVRERSSAATRSGIDESRLPDFDKERTASEKYSPFFQHTLKLLQDPEQQKSWKDWADEDQDKRHAGLTGLALSGGGIRSSTINLGITQVLHKIGLFKCLDYLSTVSGGGYIGSSISACYSEEPPKDKMSPEDEVPPKLTPAEKLEKANSGFPYQHERGHPEPVAFHQLRNYSSFLVPHGFIDYMKLPVQIVRGVVINFMVMLPWIIGLAFLTRWQLSPEDPGEVAWIWARYVPEWFNGTPFGFSAVLISLFLALAFLFPIVRKLQYSNEGSANMRPFRKHYESAMVVVLLVPIATAWIEFQPVALNALYKFIDNPGAITAAVGGSASVLAVLANLFARQIKTLLGRWSLYLVAFVLLLAFWLLYLLLCSWLLQAPQWWTDLVPQTPIWVVLSPAFIVLFLYGIFLVSANGLSMHNFYRDRLAKAFLFRVDRVKDKIESGIDPKLTELSGEIGPLHLINTTLNTRKFPERFRKGRHAEPFFLSSICSGSRITGYCETGNLEDEQSDVSLSTAVATSGAAVSSNMGVHSNPALRFILSVLNIRLGYWIVNPMLLKPGKKKFWTKVGKFMGVGIVRFIQELSGQVSYKTSYVYLSDGGHIENLGIYELVRRQCRLIIVGDGESDTDYTFKGLSDALRLIRVDFGINIEMDGLDEIRGGEQQYARGTIHYPDERVGYLIYLKSSLLGDDMVEATVSEDAYVSSPLRADDRHFDELGYIANYKAEHPDFPQESTADQFFDETQFECYRALGYLIASRAFTGDG